MKHPIHPNEVNLLYEKEYFELLTLAHTLGSKHVEALEVQRQRQTEFVKELM